MKLILSLLLFSSSAWADEVRVAIIDTGVNLSHQEFKPFLDRHPKDGLQAYDFLTKKRNTVDTQGHGTNIASIITLGNKDKFKIIPLRFTDGEDSADATSFFNTRDQFVKALEMAIGLDVDVINISYTHRLSSYKEEELLKKALEKKIIVVVAAGNSGDNFDKPTDSFPPLETYPCNYKIENVICVGNWDKEKNKRAESSNFGGRVSVYTDGNNVVGLGKTSKNPEDSLNIMSGTSQAAAKISRWVIHQKIKGKKFDEILKTVQSQKVIKEIP